MLAPQLALFEGHNLHRVINVASVPQRSPFRYPGGKTWLVPMVRHWLKSLPTRPELFIEPFAGGGIIALTVAAESLADHVVMVEMDDQVAAVWRTILNGQATWLAEQIVAFSLTADNAAEVLSQRPHTIREKAFQTILKNRIFHGGILANGSGMLKHGENGKGIKSRWYPETLARRILDIAALRRRFTFIEGDGIGEMRRYAKHPNAVYFIDPPYTVGGKKAGTRLYTHSEIDHEKLFRVAETVGGDFLMTYDNAEAVHSLAQKHSFDTAPVRMKNTHHAQMSELLVGRNLHWARA